MPSQFLRCLGRAGVLQTMSSDQGIKIHEWGHDPEAAALSELRDGEAHVWFRPLNAAPEELAALRNLLSPDEEQRALRFHFDKHRSEFILTRASLRILLGACLSRPAAEIRFASLPHGKPEINGDAMGLPATGLRFNVSHTDGLAALALILGREIGVDVEKLRAESDFRKLAGRFFSERERNFLETLSGDELRQAFFRCWTRKEAYLKARGEGLTIPLHQFDVSLARDEPAALLGTRPDASEAGRWVLYDLAPGPEYAAALAVSAPVRK